MPTLLLVEDNQHIQRIYREKFRREGFAVTMATNGREGLLAARQGRPDAILLDIMMPEVNGFELLHQLRAEPDLSATPVFMLSNKAWPDDIQHSLSLGARRFYSKGSASLQEIVTQIRHDCGLKKLILISPNAKAAEPVVAVLQHPRLLCCVVSVMAEMSAAERSAPDLIVLDTTPPAPNASPLLGQLKSTPATRAVPVLAITDHPDKFARADHHVSPAHLTTALRPAVLNQLALTDPVAVAAT